MQRRALVLRVWMNHDGEVHGQLRDPLTGWQQPFTAPEELWRAIARVLDLTDPPPLRADPGPESKE